MTARRTAATSAPSPLDPSKALTKEARAYAWDFFALHAKQRIDVLRLSLFVYAFLVAASVAALNARVPSLAAGFAGLYALISVLFLVLDLRGMQLIKLAERHLANHEAALRRALGDPTLDFLAAAERDKPTLLGVRISFGGAFQVFFATNILAGVVTAVLILRYVPSAPIG